MRLLGSSNSPFVRKVRVLSAELGLEHELAFEVTDPRDAANDLDGFNPLRKVPTLVDDDGNAIHDSAVICQWLIENHDNDHIFLPVGPARIRSLVDQSIADGMLDAAVLVRQELLRPAPLQSTDWIAAQTAKVDRALARFAADPSWRDREIDLATIAVGCALEWLQFRFPDHTWPQRHPELSRWNEEFGKRPSMQATRPV